MHTHTHTHTTIYIYIYKGICMYLCICMYITSQLEEYAIAHAHMLPHTEGWAASGYSCPRHKTLVTPTPLTKKAHGISRYIVWKYAIMQACILVMCPPDEISKRFLAKYIFMQLYTDIVSVQASLPNMGVILFVPPRDKRVCAWITTSSVVVRHSRKLNEWKGDENTKLCFSSLTQKFIP